MTRNDQAASLNITPITRKIIYKDRELEDLKPTGSVAEVLRLHATTNPELITANTEGPVMKGGTQVYTVSQRVGNKG